MADDVTRPCDEHRTTERVNYFDGQMLTAADFAAEQSYLIDKLRAHNRLLHGYGTVCGLGVTPTGPPSGSVVVEPGVAIDCCGREIVLTEPIEVDLSEMLDDMKRSDQLYVTVEHDEIGADPTPRTDGEPTPARMREVARVGVTQESPDGSDPSGASNVRPCPPCTDPRVVLATVRRSRSGTIVAEDIDNDARLAVPTPAHHARPADEPKGCRKKRWGAGLLAAALSWVVFRRRTSGQPAPPG